MSKNFNDWITEGETLYNAAMSEYEDLVRELEELEQRRAAKRDEVNQIAKVINKPEVESVGRAGGREGQGRGDAVSGELVGGEGQPKGSANSSNTIARALTGRTFNR